MSRYVVFRLYFFSILMFSFQILQEAVGCMCTVVQHLTHDFVRLVNLLKSCNGTHPWLVREFYIADVDRRLARLQQSIKRPAAQELSPNETRALVILIFIVALLAENCNFDTLRKENSSMS